MGKNPPKARKGRGKAWVQLHLQAIEPPESFQTGIGGSGGEALGRCHAPAPKVPKQASQDAERAPGESPGDSHTL